MFSFADPLRSQTFTLLRLRQFLFCRNDFFTLLLYTAQARQDHFYTFHCTIKRTFPGAWKAMQIFLFF